MSYTSTFKILIITLIILEILGFAYLYYLLAEFSRYYQEAKAKYELLDFDVCQIKKQLNPKLFPEFYDCRNQIKK